MPRGGFRPGAGRPKGKRRYRTALCQKCGKEIGLFYRRKKYGVCLRCEPTAHYSEYALTKYGLTLESFEKLLIFQGGLCAICRKPDVSLVIDHDHGRGGVRGILCYSCNTHLGWYENRSDIIIDYLNGLNPFATMNKVV